MKEPTKRDMELYKFWKWTHEDVSRQIFDLRMMHILSGGISCGAKKERARLRAENKPKMDKLLDKQALLSAKIRKFDEKYLL